MLLVSALGGRTHNLGAKLPRVLHRRQRPTESKLSVLRHEPLLRRTGVLQLSRVFDLGLFILGVGSAREPLARLPSRLINRIEIRTLSGLNPPSKELDLVIVERAIVLEVQVRYLELPVLDSLDAIDPLIGCFSARLHVDDRLEYLSLIHI